MIYEILCTADSHNSPQHTAHCRAPVSFQNCSAVITDHNPRLVQLVFV